MKHLFIILCSIIAYSLEGADVPIIFLHGHKSSAKPPGSDGGWRTWNSPSSTAMMRIINEGYKGYTEGSPRDCDEGSSLSSTNGETRKVYNFSYYHPTANAGVIGLSEEQVLVYVDYDIAGNRINIFPYMTEYPPSEYDHTELWPKYSPLEYYSAYNASWSCWRYAKKLAEFIDKVLTATGASKVDIVAHSMGGLVARVAIKNYGCASKVRKLLMVGTPNYSYSRLCKKYV